MTTFADVLADRLRGDTGRPLVTFYDLASGERVELSVATYGNWVAKAAGLLADEHDLARGARLRIALPAHWLGTVFLGAAWSAGLVVTGGDDADAVVCGPDTLSRWADRAADIPVLACSLLPLGARFPEPPPPGVHDVGVEIWSQPDAFEPWDPPAAADPAYQPAGEPAPVTQRQLWQAATTGGLLTDGGRLLTTANPVATVGVLTEPLARRGSLVLVASAEPERLDAVASAERATARFPG